MDIFITIVAGIIVGILSGLVGVGGGIVMVPLLVFGLHMTQHKAQGTSLAALLLPSAIFACYEYYKAGNVDIKVALLLAVGIGVGAYFGAVWALHVPAATLKRGFGVLLLIVGTKLILLK